MTVVFRRYSKNNIPTPFGMLPTFQKFLPVTMNLTKYLRKMIVLGSRACILSVFSTIFLFLGLVFKNLKSVL
jgi:hypothetical protein